MQAMWADEHLVGNEVGHVVRLRIVRRCVEKENSGPDVIKLIATLSYLKPDTGDMDVQGKWTPIEGCKACETEHGNEHIVRCEAHR